MNNKKHLTVEGYNKILSIRASINKGLSPKLLECFPGITPVNRPEVKASEIKDSNWLAGFTAAEGCFMVKVYKSTSKLGESVQLVFVITQHSRDTELMKGLIKYMGCGGFSSSKSYVTFNVAKFPEIFNIIIPFFKKYPLV
jgi:hypothetical protein